MLVLSRKAGERIRIGPDIVVTIVGTGGGRARVGIEAPASVAIVLAERAADRPPGRPRRGDGDGGGGGDGDADGGR